MFNFFKTFNTLSKFLIPLCFSNFSLLKWGREATISILFLGIFCLALAFWLWSEGLARQTAAEVGVYLYIEPLITMIGAWIILDEAITWWIILGALFISLGVYVSERFGKLKIGEHDI